MHFAGTFPGVKACPHGRAGEKWPQGCCPVVTDSRLSAVVPAEHRAGAVAQARLHSQHLWLGQAWDDSGPSLASHGAPGDRTAREGVQPQFSIFTRPEALSGARSPEI